MFSGRERVQSAVTIICNSRDTILHFVKDQAYCSSGVISPGYKLDLLNPVMKPQDILKLHCVMYGFLLFQQKTSYNDNEVVHLRKLK